MSRGEGSAWPLTPDADIAQIREDDRAYYGLLDDHDYVRDFPSRPADAELMPTRIYHMRTTNGGRMPCCNKSPWDISPWDRLTKYPALVTCERYGERYVRELNKCEAEERDHGQVRYRPLKK